MYLIKRIYSISIKDITFGRVYRAFLRRVFDIPDYISWQFSRVSKNNKKYLLSFRDKHKGERCFIVANGPSLQKTDLSLLRDEITIGMNRIYLLKNVNGFVPTYLAVSDVPIQLYQFAEEYNSVQITRFFNWKARKKFTPQKNLYFFKQGFKMNFQPNLLKPVGAGKSVTYFCIQLAFFMGFKEVILIGKDHSYNIEGKPGVEITSNGHENNHFIKGYYQPNQKWKIPNYTEEEYSYKLAKVAFENNGREIVDATIDGKLNVFKKVDYYSLFNR